VGAAFARSRASSSSVSIAGKTASQGQLHVQAGPTSAGSPLKIAIDSSLSCAQHRDTAKAVGTVKVAGLAKLDLEGIRSRPLLNGLQLADRSPLPVMRKRFFHPRHLLLLCKRGTDSAGKRTVGERPHGKDGIFRRHFPTGALARQVASSPCQDDAAWHSRSPRCPIGETG
jgi:hypothetical protein